MKPTHELYQSLLSAYEHFNQELFEASLPEVIFTVQRQNGVLGYFAPDRWSCPEGKMCHEIAINPTHIGKSRVIEVLQTLVHEMVHCWQYCFGTPGRNCYHNKEWAYKMKAIGLQPTSTGKPGGAIVGQCMSDYPIEGGAFVKACEKLVFKKSYQLPWIDRQAAPPPYHFPVESESSNQENIQNQAQPLEKPRDSASISNVEGFEKEASSNSFLHLTYADLLPEDTFVAKPIHSTRGKTTYICRHCDIKVWGRPKLKIVCGECGGKFENL